MSENLQHPGAAEPDAALAERRRRRRLLALTLALLLGLPLYLVTVSLVLGALTAPVPGPDGAIEKPLHWAVELLIYIVLGMVWALPLKRLATGVGKKP